MNRNALGFLLFILAVALGFGVLLPKINEVRDVTVDMKAKTTIANNKQKRLDDLRQVQTTFSSQKDRVALLLSTLPQEPEVPEIIVSVEAMGRENGLSIESLLPQVNADDEEVTLTLVGEGDLGAVERFMQAIADNNRPMSVTALSLTRKQESNALAVNATVLAPYISLEAANETAEVGQ
jgi:Tfp pilus assembly protein PilO